MMAYSMNQPSQAWGRDNARGLGIPPSTPHSGMYLLNTPKSLQPGSICPLCRVKVGIGHDYNAHLGSLQHAEGYLKEMSQHGPGYFYQMYDNLPFADPARSSKIGWSPLNETIPFMVYVMRCGVFCGFKCKGCVKQFDSIEDYREHILGKEHMQRTSFRISSIGESKYREIHFDVPSWPQEKLFEGHTSVFPSLNSSEDAGLNQESKPYDRVGHDNSNGSAKMPNLLDRWPGLHRDEGTRKRGLSPDRFIEKRPREDESNSSQDKASSVANQLQKMLQQLVQGPNSKESDVYQRQASPGGSRGASNISSNQQALLNEMMGNIGESSREQKLSSEDRWGPRHENPQGNQSHDRFKSQFSDELPSSSQGQVRAREQQKEENQFEEKVLFLNGLPREFDSNALGALCSPFGHVGEARIISKGKKEPYGFVEMSTRRECMKIIQALNGHTMPGCNRQLFVNFANKKRDQRNTGQGHDDPGRDLVAQRREDDMLQEAKRREEALRQEVLQKEEELKKEAARLEIERKQAELQRKMDRIEAERKQVAREREQEKIRLEMEKRIREEEERRRQAEQGRQVMSESEVYETQLREAQIREEEILKAQMNEERQAQMHGGGLHESQNVSADRREVQFREVQNRDREILEHELRARGLHEAEIREMLIRHAENREREMRENEMQEIQMRELRERQMREEAAMHERRSMNDSSKPQSLLDLPIQAPPENRPPVDGPAPFIREQVMETIDQLEKLGVRDLEILPRLLDVMGELNPATLRVLGEMEPAMLERFCVVDPHMLVQLANAVPGLQRLVEQVNLPALISLLRCVGPIAVQMLARTFAYNPEVFLAMRAMVHNVMAKREGGGDMGAGPIGDGILPTPEPFGVAMAHQLQMIQEQISQNSAPWPPRH